MCGSSLARQDELARPGGTEGLTELEGQLASEDVEGLVEVVVVYGPSQPWGDAELDDSDDAA